MKQKNDIMIKDDENVRLTLTGEQAKIVDRCLKTAVYNLNYKLKEVTYNVDVFPGGFEEIVNKKVMVEITKIILKIDTIRNLFKEIISYEQEEE